MLSGSGEIARENDSKQALSSSMYHSAHSMLEMLSSFEKERHQRVCFQASILQELFLTSKT